MVIMIYQVFIYVKYHKVGKEDLRIWVYILSILSAINTFAHYELISGDLAKKTVFIVYVNSYLTYLLVGNYYVHKAGKLVGNKQVVRYFTIIFGVLMIILIILSGIYFIFNETKHLCKDSFFVATTFVPLLISLGQGFVFQYIRKNIDNSEKISVQDR